VSVRQRLLSALGGFDGEPGPSLALAELLSDVG
jgi:hypothetical protein